MIREKFAGVQGKIKVWPRWGRRLLITAIVALVAFGIWRWATSPSDADKQKMAAIKADPRVVCEGIVVPVRYASMSLQLSGVVSEILVSEGEQVQPGQILVKLASEDLRAKAASARANYLKESTGSREQEIAMKKALMEQAAVTLEQARIDYQRMESLHAQNAVSRQEFDKSRTAWLKATADWEHAKADYEMARAGSRSETIAVARAEAEAALRQRSGTHLAGWESLSEAELDLLLEFLAIARADGSDRSGVTGDGRWRVTLGAPAGEPSTATLPSPRGRLVTINWRFELEPLR